MSLRFASPWVLFAAALSTSPAAWALPPPGADVIFVRQDCTAFVDPSICVETMADASAWVPTRTPANNPALIDVGPGRDWGFFACTNQANVTLRGAGRDTTRLTRPTGAGGGAIDVTNCVDFAVESLTAHGSFAGVTWSGGGSSTWSDTDLVGGGAEFDNENFFSLGWYDENCSSPALHYFFGSRARALGTAIFNYAFVARCEHWFFGGEILATSETDEGTSQTAVLIDGAGDMRVFGTAVRSGVGASVSQHVNSPLPGVPGGMHGVYVQENGVLHAHGAIVSVGAKTSNVAQQVTGLQVNGAGTRAHTPGTAFVVDAGPGGAAARLRGTGLAESPFLWQQGAEPPRADIGNPGSPFVTSIQGADLFVETDCSSGGSCSGGSEPHLMVYSPSCTTNGPWFDVVTGACRP